MVIIIIIIIITMRMINMNETIRVPVCYFEYFINEVLPTFDMSYDQILVFAV